MQVYTSLTPISPLTLHPLTHHPGRKSGKGCYVYSGRKGKNKAVNSEAEQLLEKYRIPIKGRSVMS